MTERSEPTYYVRIYMSGPIEVAAQVCREECFRQGLCVTLDSTRFIYTGGEESGFVVGLVNYPRFPSRAHELWQRAEHLARLLMERTCQHSALIVDEEKTHWISTKETQPTLFDQ